MNNFEKYLKDHQKELEPDTVNPEVWLSIENELLRKRGKQKTIYLRIISVAAAIAIGLLLSVSIFKGSSNIEEDLLAKYNLEQYNFPQQVNGKRASLAKAMIPSSRQEDFKILIQQLAFLDEQYRDYLAYIQKNGYQEFIGNQILNYYKSKIELLDKIQKEIEKINYYENKFPSNSQKVELEI